MRKSKFLITLSILLSISSTSVFASTIKDKTNSKENIAKVTSNQNIDNSKKITNIESKEKDSNNKVSVQPIRNSNKNLAVNETNENSYKWELKDNKWYYKSTDKVTTGFKEIDNYLYYFDNNGIMQTGWQKIDSTWYYFREDGNMKTGWEQINGYWYYFNNDGSMKTGWQKIDDTWYYFREDGNMKTGWEQINGYWYYFNNDGLMKTGWQKIDGTWYYFREDGNMKTGWEKFNNYWYYLNPSNGAMLFNTEKTINNIKYRFDKNGILLTDKWIGTTYINKDGQVIEATPLISHSSLQYNVYKYMTDKNNRISVDEKAIQLHNGINHNNCVYFTSEELRRNGVKVPTYTANTHQLENYLLSHGWKTSTNIKSAKPGDILFAGYAHAFTLMHWYDATTAYIVDNQKDSFDGNILHKRVITAYDPVMDTYKATKYFYYSK